MTERRIKLRKVRASDLRKIFLWRNDKLTRASSFNSKPISWSGHLDWYHQKLKDPATLIWMAVKFSGLPVGVVRFEKVTRPHARISIFLKPSERGKGWGSLVIRQASRRALKRGFAQAIIGEIKKGNRASIKAFESAGFRLSARKANVLVYKFL